MSVLPDGLPRPVPSDDGLDRLYWEGTRRHEVLQQGVHVLAGARVFHVETGHQARHQLRPGGPLTHPGDDGGGDAIDDQHFPRLL